MPLSKGQSVTGVISVAGGRLSAVGPGASPVFRGQATDACTPAEVGSFSTGSLVDLATVGVRPYVPRTPVNLRIKLHDGRTYSQDSRIARSCDEGASKGIELAKEGLLQRQMEG